MPETLLNDIWQYLLRVLVLSGQQVFYLFSLVLILGFVVQLLNVRFYQSCQRFFGSRLYLWLFGWIGIPIHELGHAVFALMFGHKIKKAVFFDPKAKGGNYGSVIHTWNKGNIYHEIGNLFIGASPIIFGAIIIWLLLSFVLDIRFSKVHYPLPDPNIVGLMNGFISFCRLTLINTGQLFAGLRDNFSWKTGVFLYISFAICTNLNMSVPDLKHIPKAGLLFFVLILVFNLATAWIGDFSLVIIERLGSSLAAFNAVLVFLILLSLVFWIPLLILNSLFKR